MTTKRMEILADSFELVERALSLILAQIKETFQGENQPPFFSIVLSGGSTPKPLYQALSRENLPWDKIHIFWGDERYVPVDHPDSNQGMARSAWLDLVNIPAPNIHPMPTDSQNPALDAQKYEDELKQCFGTELPTFDLILLGMGDDGHTASLFPHTEALKVTDKLVTVGFKGEDPRITLTLPLINHANCVIFLVAGENKQYALSHIFAAQADELSYPARAIQPQGNLWWLLDKKAGQELKENNKIS